MPIGLKPFKILCPKCGLEKIVKFKSDCLSKNDFEQMSQICPKCGNMSLCTEMAFENLDILGEDGAQQVIQLAEKV
jgi:hypothetical protein